jgi:carotenoid cleavage dioxygenase-like enzyme
VHHGGQLLALWEGGSPSEIDPETLAYLGPHNLGGVARVAPAFSVHPALDGALGIGGDAVCAHVRRDPLSGRLVMLLSRFALNSTRLRFIEFAPGGFTKVSERTHVVKGFTAVHDFALTADSYVFFCPPLTFDAAAFRKGSSALDSVSQRPGPTSVVFLPRRGDGNPVVVEATRCFATHILGASETATNAVVDCCATNEVGSGLKVESFRLRRVLVDKRTRLAFVGLLDSELAEFPSMDAQGHAFYAGTKNSPMDSWHRLDYRTGARLSSTLAGAVHLEPVVAGEFLVGVALLGKTQFLKVVEKATMREVYRAPIEGLNVLGLHGIWVDN